MLIWDDFHYIDNQQVVDSIAYLLQRMPAHIHLYLASRVVEQEQLFMVPLDGQGEWYRYHHLFQQFLRRELQLTWPNILNKLHLAAGHWLADHQLEQQAIENFLACASYEQVLSCLQRIY